MKEKGPYRSLKELSFKFVKLSRCLDESNSRDYLSGQVAL